MKILFLCKKINNSYGISKGLTNSAFFLANALRDDGYIVKVETVVDANNIDHEVHRYQPDIAILEALWVTPEKLEQVLRLHPTVTFIIRIHSKMPFLAVEGMAFDWLGGYKKLLTRHDNLRISSNNNEFVSDLSRSIDIEVDLLPNIYNPKLKPNHGRKPNKPHSYIIDVGCFGAIRELKNQLQQGVAAIIFAESIDRVVRFHINAGRVEQRGTEVLKNLRGLFKASLGHELIEHPWMPHSDFVKWVNFMDVGMQVSFSESFNIVTADFVYHDVPVVVSEDVDWIPSWYRADPTDTNDIVDKLHLAYKNPSLATFRNKRALDNYNKKSLKIWNKFLDKF